MTNLSMALPLRRVKRRRPSDRFFWMLAFLGAILANLARCVVMMLAGEVWQVIFVVVWILLYRLVYGLHQTFQTIEKQAGRPVRVHTSEWISVGALWLLLLASWMWL